MLTLYYTPSCPYCQRVLGEVENMGLKMNLRDISTDEVAMSELIEKGGKRQVPYLEDPERGISMYESGDIVAYLAEHYEGQTTSGHNICESCQ